MSEQKKTGTDINTAPKAAAAPPLGQQVMPTSPPQQSLGKRWENGKLVPDLGPTGVEGAERGGITYEQLKAKKKAQEESAKAELAKDKKK